MREPRPHDTDEHGTHTAGTITGRKVGSTAFGVAPEAILASTIVIEGGNVIARILAGMDWVVGLGVRGTQHVAGSSPTGTRTFCL